MTFLQLSEANIIGTVIAFILGLFFMPLVISFSQQHSEELQSGCAVYYHF